MDGIKPVFTGEEKKAAKIAELTGDVEYLRITLPLMVEHTAMMAKITRAKYLALVDAGFTKNEAFALCK